MTIDTHVANMLSHARQMVRNRHADRYEQLATDLAEDNPASAALAAHTANGLRNGDSMHAQVPEHVSAAVEAELEEGLQATIKDPNSDEGLRQTAGQALQLLRIQRR